MKTLPSLPDKQCFFVYVTRTCLSADSKHAVRTNQASSAVAYMHTKKCCESVKLVSVFKRMCLLLLA